MLPWRRRELTASGCRRWSSPAAAVFGAPNKACKISNEAGASALACVLRRSGRGFSLSRLSFCDLTRCGARITGGFSSSGGASGNSNAEVSPISIGMVAAGWLTIEPVASSALGSALGSALSRPAGRPAIEGAGGGAGAAGATSTCSGLSGSSRNRLNSSARRMAASMRNCRHSGWSPRAIIAPCIGRTPVRDGANEPSGGRSARTKSNMARSTPPTGRIRRIGSITCA